MGITPLGVCRAMHSAALLAVPLASAAPCLPSHQFTFQIMMLCLWLIPLRPSPSSQAGQGDLRGKGIFHPWWLTAMPSGMPSLGEGLSQHVPGLVGAIDQEFGRMWGRKGKKKAPSQPGGKRPRGKRCGSDGCRCCCDLGQEVTCQPTGRHEGFAEGK